jgi:phage terminase Nu1 subunit (DNA packaging protein)
MTRTTTLDTTAIAKLFLITPQHVRKLVGRGILMRARDVDGKELMGRFELVANMHAYIKYLREQARLDDASENRYQQLRNEKMSSETAIAQLNLKERKGQVLRTRAVEFVMTNLITATKAHLLAIPSRVSRLLIGCDNFQVIYDLIYAEIETALRELSEWRPGMFAAQNAAWLNAQGADPSLLRENGQSDDQSANASDEAAGRAPA